MISPRSRTPCETVNTGRQKKKKRAIRETRNFYGTAAQIPNK